MKERIHVRREREVLSLINGIAYSRVPAWYGCTARDLKMDLILPKHGEDQSPRPAILWICGGAFCVVDRSVWLPELVALARRGYIVASVEYRTGSEGTFPLPLIDIKSAVRFLRASAAEFGVDPARICAMGESAGGTLACLAGLTGERKEFDRGQNLHVTSTVQAVVDFYGIADFQAMRETGAAEGVPGWALDAFTGGPSNAFVDPVGAARHAAGHVPPFLLLHGDKDAVVPVRQSEELYEQLAAKGADVRLCVIEGGTHGDDVFYQDEAMQKVLEFLDGAFKARF